MVSPSRATIRQARPQSWIDRIVEANRNHESPARYWWWSALSAISAVTRKKIVLRRSAGELYPNIYVAIVSKDSGLRKGAPIRLISKLLKKAECTRVIEGRSSFQAMFSELSKQVSLKGGEVISDAHGIIISSEFDTMLVKDPDALSNLTLLYNTHEIDDFTVRLKGSGTETLKNPYMTLLVASNETLFDKVVRAKDMEGGFIARTFIVYESQTTVINDLLDDDPDAITEEMFSELVKELKEISKMSGEFSWTEEAKEIYRPWYYKLRTSKFQDETGTINRLGDSVVKVAMLLNLVGKRDLKIHEEDVQLAITKCEECLPGVRIVSHGSKTVQSDLSEVQLSVLKMLFDSKNGTGVAMEKRTLLRKLWPKVDIYSLERAAESLQETGSVEIIGPPRKPVYRITAAGIELFTQFCEQIQEGDH